MDDELGPLKLAFAGRYRIERELGRGAMGTVYLAEEPRHSRRVALKVLRPERVGSASQERFLREIKTTAGLSHPHILRLFDSGEMGGYLYYAMPFIEGESLRHRLTRERQLAVDEALEIATEIADALGFAHSHAVVHRDVKPENILFEAGHAILADFGIAKAIHDSTNDPLTATGFVVGTPQYMSPEQGEGIKELDGRSDMYSLACVLYEMLVGDPPFTGSVPLAIVRRKMVQPATPLRVIRESVPTNVEAAVGRALAKVPADRFRTMQRFVDALTDPNYGQAGEHTLANPVESAGRPRWMSTVPITLKPLDGELDTFGLTHPGKVQRLNQDHFLIGTVRRELYLHLTSLIDGSRLPHGGQRRAMMGLIADGFGRGSWGEEASRLAVEVVAQYLVHNVGSYNVAEEAAERSLVDALADLANQCHANVEQKARENPSGHGMEAGLLLWVGVWPRAYLLHFGDSRCYVLRRGQLFRSPQDVGPDRPAVSSVPVGGRTSAVIARMIQINGDVGLLCSKGLTAHISDERIRDRLATMTSAKQVCEDLLQDALDDGGTDNITVIVGRVRPPA